MYAKRDADVAIVLIAVNESMVLKSYGDWRINRFLWIITLSYILTKQLQISDKPTANNK